MSNVRSRYHRPRFKDGVRKTRDIPVCKRHLFRMAWDVSINAADTFGGSPKEYFAAALREQWDLYRDRAVSRAAHQIAAAANAGKGAADERQPGSALLAAASRGRERLGRLYGKCF